MPKITFTIADAEQAVDIANNETVLNAAQKLDIDLSPACGGNGSCGLCKVRVLEGKEHLTEPNENEQNHLGSANFAVGERLACQVIPTGDLKVTRD